MLSFLRATGLDVDKLVTEITAMSNDFQSVIPSTNIMYPVTKIKDLPDAFKDLEVPKYLQLNPEEINNKKEKWIDEWLNAS